MSEGREQNVKGGTSHDEVSLFTMAAHELKNPLALIRQLALGMSIDELSMEQKSQTIDRILLTSERALRLTSNLTRSHHLEPTLFPLEPLNSLIMCREVVSELSPLYAARGRAIRIQNRDTAPLAVANRDLLRRVLIQFADNALNYASAGAPVEMSVKTSQSGIVRIGVRDFGPGLAPKTWQNTKRAGIISTRRPASSGIGLLIAERFAKVMDAKIGVTRHRNGASFYIDLHASRQLSLL